MDPIKSEGPKGGEAERPQCGKKRGESPMSNRTMQTNVQHRDNCELWEGAIGKPPREMMMLEELETEIEKENTETQNDEWGTDEKNPWRYLDGWEALANAIILRAAEDYREARVQSRITPG